MVSYKTILLQGVFQVRVLESKVGLDSCAPTSLVVKIDVRSLFVLVRRDLGFFVALEPSHVLFVESPTLLLQFTSRQVLLIGSLRIVEYEEETVRSQLFEHSWIVKKSRRRGGVRSR